MFSYFKKDITIHKDRNFYPNYFKDDLIFNHYIQNGYCVCKNVVSNTELEEMENLYLEICNHSEFSMDKKFLNSGRLESSFIRNKVVEKIKDISKIILKDLVNQENCSIGNGGAFQIKPPTNDSALNPHQDTPIVDESTYYSVYVWIPLCDTTSLNGCLSLIPKSHLWGNHQRSLNVPWKYQKDTKKLWKKMIDIPISKGDLILFDSALIHGSRPNKSKDVRVAFTTAILPLNFKLIHYYLDKDTPKNKVEVYEVDEYFFSNENIMLRPSSKYKSLRLEDLNK